jgi:hypothetical protein
MSVKRRLKHLNAINRLLRPSTAQALRRLALPMKSKRAILALISRGSVECR